MTDQSQITVEEGNKMIAEVCGLKCVQDRDCYPDHPEYHWEDCDGSEYKLFGGDLHWSFNTPPPFNKDWQWLMPVVDKVNKLFDEERRKVSYEHTDIEKYREQEELPNQLDNPLHWRSWSYHHVRLSTNISDVWNNLINSLQWYNSHKSKQ